MDANIIHQIISHVHVYHDDSNALNGEQSKGGKEKTIFLG